MRFTVCLPPTTRSIGAARHALDRLACELDEQALRNARLLVSELVTNVVRHADAGAADIEVVVACEGRRLHVEVGDRGTGFEPAPRRPGQDVGSGWGLHLLDVMASRWGVERADGSRVWFEIDPLADDGFALTG